MTEDLDKLTVHLSATTGLSHSRVQRLVGDVLTYFDETVEAFVTRRHRELMNQGLKNDAIYGQLDAELRARRFATAPLTERQIRRLIYG